jgi:hypothetical protein
MDAFPKDLQDTYKDSLIRMGKMHPMDRAIADAILLWVTHAKRPMTPEEIVVAAFFQRSLRTRSSQLELMALRNSPKIIRDNTFQLVEVDGGFVRFHHYSVKEFLVPPNQDFETTDDVEPNVQQAPGVQRVLDILRDFSVAHTTLAKVCLKYLLSPTTCEGQILKWDSDRNNTRVGWYIQLSVRRMKFRTP